MVPWKVEVSLSLRITFTECRVDVDNLWNLVVIVLSIGFLAAILGVVVVHWQLSKDGKSFDKISAVVRCCADDFPSDSVGQVCLIWAP